MLHFHPSQHPRRYRPQINNCRGTQIMRFSLGNFVQPHAFSFSCTYPTTTCPQQNGPRSSIHITYARRRRRFTLLWAWNVLQAERFKIVYINKSPTWCKLCSLIYFTAKSLYMYWVSQHPSSGVLKTVTAASGTGHNIGPATSFQRVHVWRK